MLKKVLFLMISFSLFVFAADAELDIIKKSVNLPKIEISISSGAAKMPLTQKVKQLVENDLKVSGHFDVIDTTEVVDFNSTPNMLALSNRGTDLFLNIDSSMSGFGGYSVLIKLYDINLKKLVFYKTLTTAKEERYPFLAHRTAIAVNQYLNAPSIDWMDKFVIFSQYKSAKKADIIIADYTLTFQQEVIKGGLNIFPKWADRKKGDFYYTTYDRGVPTLVKTNLYTRKRETIMKSEGMVVASDVNSDGTKLLVTASPESQPDIYMYDTRTRNKIKLTNYKGIDVGAHFVENDTKIVFVSDRLGYPNIFSKKIKDRGVERLVYHGRNNSSATTYKDYVVYTSRDKDNEFGGFAFNLYLMSTKSDYLKRLTSNGSNQFPKFSEDGESIIFIKNVNGRSSVGIIRLNYDKSFLFPLKNGKIQSIDW
ncbi:translocation protein TolB [Halarcobacter ebronensis]|uniref:Translocation protein TolB n=1 Tax=Halarcobacter ebronensis TaxID=1462615 RepID=A0A4Q0YGN2_9BACT|nr:Tol-Pal system protein TolB [Halarcobacter ebronensis]RXJ69782.1 translocation protein TolB [Halarcobacter ebronensis]